VREEDEREREEERTRGRDGGVSIWITLIPFHQPVEATHSIQYGPATHTHTHTNTNKQTEGLHTALEGTFRKGGLDINTNDRETKREIGKEREKCELAPHAFFSLRQH
jgi:hypothetical protein